jgi:hypothetical protein
VKQVGDYAFKDCRSLSEMTLPAGVTSIGIEAFMGCRALEVMDIPEGVTAIGDGAFENCSNLVSIHIPASVKRIGAAAFKNCPRPVSITVAPGNKVYDSRNDCNAIVEHATNTLLVGCGKTRIPATVTTIGDGAFAYAAGLTSLNLPSGMTGIGDLAFAHCTNLKSVSFPSSLVNLGETPFLGCYELSAISIDSENPAFDSHNKCDAIIETHTNTLLLGCRNTTIPSVVTKIGPKAFAACQGLTSIRLHEGVKVIGEQAFTNCSNLKSVSLPSSLSSIGDMAFADCRALATLEVRMRRPPVIGANTFRNCGTTKLIVPKGKKREYLSTDVWKDFSVVEEQ